MPTKLDPGGDRVEACVRALQQLREEFATDGVVASVNRVAEKTGLKQQNLAKLQKHRAIGIDFADEIARHFDTTVDGLVWLLLKGGKGAVRVGDIPGWARAADDAKDEWGDQGYRYDLAAEVRLPAAPGRVTKHFAKELARFMHEHGTASHTRLRAQRSG